MKIIRTVSALTDGVAELDNGAKLPAPEGTRVGARVAYIREGRTARLERLWDVAPDLIRAPAGTYIEPYNGPPEVLDRLADWAKIFHGKFAYATMLSAAPTERRELPGGETVEGFALSDGRFLAERLYRNGRAVPKRLAFGFFKDARLQSVPVVWDKWRVDAPRETPERLRQYAKGVPPATKPVLEAVGIRFALEEDPAVYWDVFA